jgi:hypothetical protein
MITFDSGGLIAVERNDRRITVLLERAREKRWSIAVPAGALAQVWRNGRKQVLLARLIAKPEVEVVPLDDERARAAGQLCGVRGTADVIDASVVLCARERGHRIITSDPEDLRALDPRADLVVI